MRKIIIAIIIITVVVFTTSVVKAQTIVIDSLENLLQKHISKDTARVNLLNNIADELLKVDNEKVIKYANEANELANKLSFTKGIAESLQLIGQYYYFNFNFPRALEYYHKSIEIYKNTKNKQRVSVCFNSIGIIYHDQGNYPKALDYYQKALAINEEEGDQHGISGCLNNIGIIYYEQGYYSKALDYYHKTLAINKKIGDKQGVSYCYNNIGIIYDVQENYTKALDYYQKSLKIDTELGDKQGVSYCLNNIGSIYEDQGNYTKALDCYQKAQIIEETTGDKLSICKTSINMGFVYYNTNNYTKALYYTNKSMKIAKELELLNEQMQIFELYSEIYVATKNYKKAYKNYVLYKELNDTLFSEKNIKKITSLELQYKHEKEKQAIELEQQKKNAVYEKELLIQRNTKNVVIVGLIIAAFIALLVLYGLLQKRKANRILAMQKGEIQIKNKEIILQNEVLYNNNETLEITLKKLKNTQLQLVQSKKMASLGVLTAGIAHEINNPINFVSAGINSLLLDFEDIEPIIEEINKITPKNNNLKETLKNIEQLKKDNDFDEAYKAISETIVDIKIGVDRTVEIIKGLHSFSRKDRGEFKFSNIHEEINTTLLLIKHKCKNNIEIIKNFDHEMSDIKCYPGKINQAILNIISNAIDAITGKGKIWITTKTEDTNIVISIKDNGCGMNAEIQERLFDPFFTTKSVGQGTGLGLSIVYGIIKDHKGTIKVISKPDKGSEFIIILPIILGEKNSNP